MANKAEFATPATALGQMMGDMMMSARGVPIEGDVAAPEVYGPRLEFTGERVGSAARNTRLEDINTRLEDA